MTLMDLHVLELFDDDVVGRPMEVNSRLRSNC